MLEHQVLQSKLDIQMKNQRTHKEEGLNSKYKIIDNFKNILN